MLYRNAGCLCNERYVNVRFFFKLVLRDLLVLKRTNYSILSSESNPFNFRTSYSQRQSSQRSVLNNATLSLSKRNRSCSRVFPACSFRLTFPFIINNTFSIGLRSGDLASHRNVVSPAIFFKFIGNFATMGTCIVIHEKPVELKSQRTDASLEDIHITTQVHVLLLTRVARVSNFCTCVVRGRFFPDTHCNHAIITMQNVTACSISPGDLH